MLMGFSGMAVVIYFVYRLSLYEQHLSFRRHRSTEESLADLLIHGSVVKDGIILNKNGSLMASYLYQCPDQSSQTHETLEQTSYLLNRAFMLLDSGWMIHVDAARQSSKRYIEKHRSFFGDQLSKAIDEERRQFFENNKAVYEGYFVMTLTWFPPKLLEQKILRVFLENTHESTKNRQDDILEQFEKKLARFESHLSSIFSLKRLVGDVKYQENNQQIIHDQFLQWLHLCITGKNHPIALPQTPVFIDTLIGGEAFEPGLRPKIGPYYIQTISIDGFPAESTPGMLSLLAELPCIYRWSSRFIVLDEQEALFKLGRYRAKWQQKQRGFLDIVLKNPDPAINQDAVHMALEAEEAMSDVQSQTSSWGYYTSVIILMDESPEVLDKQANSVQKLLGQLGFQGRLEDLNNIDAYLGSIPGHGVENIRKPLISTYNFSELIPTSSIWTGDHKAPCPLYPSLSPALMTCLTQGYTPFFFNLHTSDIGHTLMLGPTGAGKSTHLALLAAQLRRYPQMTVYVFDKGYSMYPLAAGLHAATKGQTGFHYNIGDAQTLAFCPLGSLRTKQDRAWALEWLEVLWSLNGIELSPQMRNRVATALVTMANSQSQSLTELSIILQDTELREGLKVYTMHGPMGQLIDAQEDSLLMSDFTVFEIEQLMLMGDKFALPVLLYLFRRIETSLQGQPAAIILDEAWLMLGHTAFREKIRQWLKTLRKANCMVIMATQSLSDALQSGILDVIVESVATTIFLPNPHAEQEGIAELYQNMGLNPRQRQIIAESLPKRQYYLTNKEGHYRLYELALGPLALAFVGVSDKESIRRIRYLEATYGHQWLEYWLAERGISWPN